MKFILGLILLIVIGAMFINAVTPKKFTPSLLDSSAQAGTPQTNEPSPTQSADDIVNGYFSQPMITPTPTTSFALKQQCANDANTFISRLTKETSVAEQIAASQGRIVSNMFGLEEAAYSYKLNTCVVSISHINIDNGKETNVEDVYDVLSGKQLAQSGYNDDSLTFFPGDTCIDGTDSNGKTCKVSPVVELEYDNYKKSIGL
jgi:hypothetical protein